MDSGASPRLATDTWQTTEKEKKKGTYMINVTVQALKD